MRSRGGCRFYQQGCVYPALITQPGGCSCGDTGLSSCEQPREDRAPPAATSHPAVPCSMGWGHGGTPCAAVGAWLCSGPGFECPGSSKGQEEQEDLTLSPSARPCCDKRGNVMCKTLVYSHQRKSGCKGQGAAVGSGGCAGSPTCHPRRAESPGELLGLGTVASSLQQLWHGGERKAQLEDTDLGILLLFLLVFQLCSCHTLFILKNRGSPCPLPLEESLPWWPHCPVPVTSSGKSMPLLRCSALMLEKKSVLACLNTSSGFSFSSGRAFFFSCSRSSRSRYFSCRTFSLLISRSNIWGQMWG